MKKSLLSSNFTTSLQRQDPSTKVVAARDLHRVESLIDDAELFFLQGNFRQALRLANQILQTADHSNVKEAVVSTASIAGDGDDDSHSATSETSFEPISPITTSTTAITDIDDNNSQCPTPPSSSRSLGLYGETMPIYVTLPPVQLNYDSKDQAERTFSVRLTKCNSSSSNSVSDPKSETLDRAAAVALQSWYEIHLQQQKYSTKLSKNLKEKQHEDYEGLVHLQPFLQAYTIVDFGNCKRNQNKLKRISNSNEGINAMSLPLFNIFVLFCVALNEHQAALIMSTHVLLYLIHHTDTMPVDYSSSREVWLILCTKILPYTVFTPGACESNSIAQLLHMISNRNEGSNIDQKEEEKLELLLNNWKSNKDDVQLNTLIELLKLFDDDSHTMRWETWPYWLRDTIPECQAKLEIMLRRVREQKLHIARTKAPEEHVHERSSNNLNSNQEGTTPSTLSQTTKDGDFDWIDRLLLMCVKKLQKFCQFCQTPRSYDDYKSLYFTFCNQVARHGNSIFFKALALKDQALTLDSCSFQSLITQWWLRLEQLIKVTIERIQKQEGGIEALEMFTRVSVAPLLVFIGWRQRRVIDTVTRKALLLFAAKKLVESVQKIMSASVTT